MKKKTSFTYLWLCVSMAFFFSCQDDHDSTLTSGKGNASVRVAFQTPDYVQVGTRATSESALKDVTVLQFIGGTLKKKCTLVDQLFIQAVELEDLVAMEASQLDDDGNLKLGGSETVTVFLANFSESFPTFLESLLEESTSYTTFINSKPSYSTAETLANLQYMPMTGFYYGGITANITNQINVTLTRSLAKINFTLNTDNFRYGGKAVSIILNGIELRNIPFETTIFPPKNRPALPVNNNPGEWPAAQEPYPTAKGDGDESLGTDADGFTKLGAIQNQSSSISNTYVAFMPENARGSYSRITSNKDKYPKEEDGVLGKGWTYIYVDLDFSTLEGVEKNATYKIYLGGDDKGDINLLAGTQYNVTTYLYGANESDTRITVTSNFDATVTDSKGFTVLDPANSYIINPVLGGTVLDNYVIPLVQARNGWRHIQSSIDAAGDNSNGEKYVDLFDNMIEDNNWVVEILWKTWEDGVLVTTDKPAIETAGSKNKYFVNLKGMAGVSAGNNCVLALKSNDGTIWWTWHLWFTDYDPDDVNDDNTRNGQLQDYFGSAFRPGGANNGKKMMDRNLGATITGLSDDGDHTQPTSTEDAVKWYGMMYQWGRKDPFTASSNGTNTISNAVKIYNKNSDQIKAIENQNVGKDSQGYDIISDNISTNHGDAYPKVTNGGDAISRLVDAVRYPLNYYHSGVSNDWTRQDNSLWNTTTKTAFDPCPPGWRVPAGGTTSAYNPWSGFFDSIFSSTTSGSSGQNGANGLVVTKAGQNVFDWVSNYNSQTGTAGRMYNGNNFGLANGGFGMNTKAWYPASGYRYQTSGAFLYIGVAGYCWSCAVNEVNGYYLGFNSAYVYPTGVNSRAYGFGVRCVQN